MIRFSVEIDTVATGGNRYGVGVRIAGDVNPHAVPHAEGATLIGLLTAINGYMHDRGMPEFDCLKGLLS